ncbi:hypothetical protein, partial [Clostridioides difficile]
KINQLRMVGKQSIFKRCQMVLANVEQVIKLAEKILNKKKCSVNKAIDIAIKILSKYEYEGMLEK